MENFLGINVSLGGVLSKAGKVMAKVMEQREKILCAFVAETGYYPGEAEQIVQVINEGDNVTIKYWIQKKEENNVS